MQTPYRKPSKFSYIKPDPNMTEAKFKQLQKKLESLKRSHPAAAAEVQRLAEDGDFSENHAYQTAKGRLRSINQRILDIENHLKQANIIMAPKNNGAVDLGHFVTVAVGDKTRTYQILGSSETDPLRGIISNNSPIGAALMNHKVGDIVKIKLADKLIEYKILEIKQGL